LIVLLNPCCAGRPSGAPFFWEQNKMPTINEINAGFDVIDIDLQQLVQHVPWPFTDQVLAKLNSSEGREFVLAGVEKILAAAEEVRATAKAPK
jgi:hypothetical protein